MICQAAIDLIKRFEGCQLQSYPDVGGVWTIGYGHTGPDVTPDTVWTQEEADNQLNQQLEFFEAGVRKLINATIDKTNENQLGALVSFTYNVGLGNLSQSSLLKYHNLGLFKAVCGEFAKWNHVAGQVVPGLTSRRYSEASLYATPSSVII